MISLSLLNSKSLSANIQIIVSAKSLFSLLLLTFWLYSQEFPGKNDHVSFICNGCLNLSENVYAHAYKEIIDESDPSQDEYTLIKIPCSKEHVCVPCGAELSIK